MGGECSSSSFLWLIRYIYKYNLTDRVTLSSFPTHETKDQIVMAISLWCHTECLEVVISDCPSEMGVTCVQVSCLTDVYENTKFSCKSWY